MKVRFLRTPLPAEAGSSNFVAGGVYDLTPRQVERWQRRDAVELVADDGGEEGINERHDAVCTSLHGGARPSRRFHALRSPFSVQVDRNVSCAPMA